MSFFRVKNRPLFVLSSTIILWLVYVNIIQRIPLQENVEYLNNRLKDYAAEKPKDFETLVLGLSSNFGYWDETQHRVVSLLRPEHCNLSYWVRSAGSSSLTRAEIFLQDLDAATISEGKSTVEVFLLRDAPSIIVGLQADDMTFEQCEKMDGYYSGGCRYNFDTRSIRFHTSQSTGFSEKLRDLISQC